MRPGQDSVWKGKLRCDWKLAGRRGRPWTCDPRIRRTNPPVSSVWLH